MQQLWGRWWQLTREELDGKNLAKEKVLLIYSIDKIADWIYECDTLLYNNLAHLLIPDVLRQVSLVYLHVKNIAYFQDLPQSFLTLVREFGKSCEPWMRNAIEGTHVSIIDAKMKSINKDLQ